MPSVIKFLTLSVLLCLFPSGVNAQRAASKTRKPALICNIASVPKGMVVIGHKRNSACSGGSELLVKTPENGDIICPGPPLPPQFSIVAEAQGQASELVRQKRFSSRDRRVRIRQLNRGLRAPSTTTTRSAARSRVEQVTYKLKARAR